MAFTYFLILWSTAWSPSRLCESEERKQTELVGPAKGGRCSPQPIWPSQKAAALPCRCVGQRPSSQCWERSPRHPGMPKPLQPAGLLRSPQLWLPPERLGSSEAGGERWGQHTQHLCESQQFPAAMENACLAHRDCSAKEGMKHHAAHQPVPTSPADVPQGSAAEPEMGPTFHQCPTGT